MLFGRGAERVELDTLLDAARTGRSGSLVLHGPAGAGKSALLDYTASASEGMRVLRATGVEPERELPFAALHQLLRPVFDRLPDLPQPQRQALEAALALAPGSGADRFVVSAAVLTLLSETADGHGLVCIVDDAQWVDAPSLDALLFAARRLDAEGVVIILGLRDGANPHPMTSALDSRLIGPLDQYEAAELVSATAAVPVSDVVIRQLVDRTAGNALALLELSSLLSTEVLQGDAALPDPLPIGAGMETAFLTRVRSLPADSQLLLLVAAAEGTGDFATVLDAAERLGADANSLTPAEAAGLLRLDDGSLLFRHPLVRSAIYSGVSSSQRRGAHAALAQSLHYESESDRRAWHRAEATLGTDDDVADDLTASAERTRLRSGFAGAGEMLHKAAGLTRDPQIRATRLVRSAEDFWLGGRPDAAHSRLDEALRLATERNTLAAITHMRARFELRRGDAADAFRMLFDAAVDATEQSPERALAMFAEASEAASYVGDVPGMIAAGQAAIAISATSDSDAEFCRDQCGGIAELFLGMREAGAARLRRVIEIGPTLTDPQHLVMAGTASIYLGEVSAAFDLLERAVAVARVADMTGNLPYVLEFLGAAEAGRGRFALSEAISAEGLGLSIETGQETSRCQHLANLATLAAWRGDEQECRRFADEVVSLARGRRLGFPIARVEWAVGALDLGLGRFTDALVRLKALDEAGPGLGHPGVAFASTLDRVEAAVRCDDLDYAESVTTLVELQTQDADTWPRAVTATCRALICTDDEAEVHFERSLELHAEGGTPPHHVARTQLLFGEWLRRGRKRVQSREHLRAAMETFEQLGAKPWADRARGELRATGETMRTHDVEALDQLTPQELRIAQAVAEGQTTKDIAARLFLSPRTVEYHLYKIFPKLGISSRTELARLVASDAGLVGPG